MDDILIAHVNGPKSLVAALEAPVPRIIYIKPGVYTLPAPVRIASSR